MAKSKSEIATFLNHILFDLGFIGKFSAFFGTLLLFLFVIFLEPARLLFGSALICLAISNSFWTHRDPGLPFPGQAAYCRKYHHIKCFWATFFFLMFMSLVILGLRLPSVSKFLTTARLGFLVPNGTFESAWRGKWTQRLDDDSSEGSLDMEIIHGMILKGTFTHNYMGKTYCGSLEGILTEQGQRAEGIWQNDIGQQGKFTFTLGDDTNFVSGVYFLEDSDNSMTQSIKWDGKKLLK